ncbi:MAG: branched-chain amino acid ABC transporter permease [Coriobacteriia bacterium]
MGVLEQLPQYLVAGLKSGAVYALMALGFTIVYAATGVINFAQGEFFMLGGMFAVWVLNVLGAPLWASAVLAVLLTAVVAVIFEVLAIRPRKDGDPLALIIITVGGSMLIQSLARHAFGPDELALPPFTEGGSLHVLGALVERQAVWVWVLTALAVAGLSLLYSKTRLGLAMKACAIDREAAQLMGIDTRFVVTVTFALAGLLGAVAGVAVTPLTQTIYNVGSGVGLKGFAAAILGGLGSPLAAVVGGLVLGLAESVSIAVLSSEFKDATAILLLLAVLFFRPEGLLKRARREKV